MKLLALVLLTALTTACGRQQPLVFEKVSDKFDGMILQNENGDRTFLVQMKDSTGYIITEGVLDTTEQVFVYAKDK